MKDCGASASDCTFTSAAMPTTRASNVPVGRVSVAIWSVRPMASASGQNCRAAAALTMTTRIGAGAFVVSRERASPHERNAKRVEVLVSDARPPGRDVRPSSTEIAMDWLPYRSSGSRLVTAAAVADSVFFQPPRQLVVEAPRALTRRSRSSTGSTRRTRSCRDRTRARPCPRATGCAPGGLQPRRA